MATQPGAALCVTFRLTLAEFRAGSFALAWRWPLKFVAAVAGLAAVAGIFLAVTGGGLLGIAFIAVAVFYSAGLGWLLFFRPGSQYRRVRAYREEQTYCFGDDDVSWTFLEGASHVKWAFFGDLLETKSLFILRYQTKRLGSLIPKRAFTSPQDQASFRRLAQRIGKAGQSP